MHSSKGYNASTPADVSCSRCLLSILYAHILLECIVLPFFCGDDIERDLLTDMNLARNLLFQAICLLRVEMERAFSGRSSPDATLGTESVPHKSQVEAV